MNTYLNYMHTGNIMHIESNLIMNLISCCTFKPLRRWAMQYNMIKPSSMTSMPRRLQARINPGETGLCEVRIALYPAAFKISTRRQSALSTAFAPRRPFAWWRQPPFNFSGDPLRRKPSEELTEMCRTPKVVEATSTTVVSPDDPSSVTTEASTVYSVGKATLHSPTFLSEGMVMFSVRGRPEGTEMDLLRERRGRD